MSVLAASASAQPKSDWEIEYEKRNRQEAEVTLPPYPKSDGMIEFDAETRGDFRFFVDSASLVVANDGVVRYSLVARSSTGVENVSHEGMRCQNREWRVYAYGNPDKSWREVSSSWRRIEQRWHVTLRRDYFCPSGTIIYSAAEGVQALRQGGNSKLKLQRSY